MTELDGARDEALYIGFSRTSTFLSIFCPKNARRRLPAAFSRVDPWSKSRVDRERLWS
jgi:hypothetical protein